MEKLENKYNNLLKAFEKLSLSLKKYSHPPKQADQEDIEIYMTALIKRFEMTFELLWKFLKQYLKVSQSIETLGSKDVIRSSFAYNILKENEDTILLDIVDARNEISHTYNEDTAYELCKKINNEYYPVFSQLIPRLEKLID